MRTSTSLRVGGARRTRGLTLIELLVSLAIGLVLMVAVVSAYIGSAGATRAAEAQGRMNEDGQAALAILAQQIRMAGNNPRQINYSPDSPSNPVFGSGTYAIRGCEGMFSNLSTATSAAALTCTNPGGSDSIAVVYEADRYNTIRNSANVATDCLGQALTTVSGSATKVLTVSPLTTGATNVTFTVADNRFYVGTSTSITTPSLFCKGNGGTTTSPQPLVENVEDLQFTYGTSLMGSTSTASLSVKGYLTATELAAVAATNGDPERWSKVLTVRICALVRSETPVAPDAESARYVQCDGTVNTSPPDLRLRRAYSTTVVLRNRASTE